MRIDHKAIAVYEREILAPALGWPKESFVRPPRVHETRLDQQVRDTQSRIAATKLSRIDLLGRIRREVDPLDLGYSRTSVFANEELGISHRSFQDAARISRETETRPLLRRAMAEGIICESKVLTILPVLDVDNEVEWLRTACSLTNKALRERVQRERDLKKERAVAEERGPAKELCGKEEPEKENPTKERREDPDPRDFGLRSLNDLNGFGNHGANHRYHRGMWLLVDVECPTQFRWIFEAFCEDVARRTGGPANSSQALEVLLAEFEASNFVDLYEPPDEPPEFFENETDGGIREIPQTGGKGMSVIRVSNHDDYVLSKTRLAELDAVMASEFGSNGGAEAVVEDLVGGNAAGGSLTGTGLSGANPTGKSATGTNPLGTNAANLIREFRSLEAKLRSLRNHLACLLYDIRSTHAWRPLGFDCFREYVEDRLDVSVRTANQWIRAWQTRSRTLHEAQSAEELRTTSLLALSRIERAGAGGESMRLWRQRATEVTAAVLEQQVRWAMAHEDLLPMPRSADDDLGDADLGDIDSGDTNLGGNDLGGTNPGDDPGDTNLDDTVSRPPRLRLAPPSEVTWPAIADRLRRTPELISLPAFHEAAFEHDAEIQRDAMSACWVDGSDTCVGNDTNDTDDPDCDPAGESVGVGAAGLDTQSDPTEVPEATDDVPPDPTAMSKAAADFFGKISACYWEEMLRVPDPTEKCTSVIRLRTDIDLLDALDRTIRRVQAAHGEDKPDWWCLELMILYVRNGWVLGDRDFRRRTAEFNILARDGFQCTSPRCNARTNLNVHHIDFRSQGGSDDPSNLTTLCAACHLQGVHTRATIAVGGMAPHDLRWSYGADAKLGFV